MDLHIHISTTQSLNLHVHIHLQHITTQEQSNTIKCLHPGSDIGHLEEHIYNEILELDTHMLDTLPEEEIIHSRNVTLSSLKTKRFTIYKLLICVH